MEPRPDERGNSPIAGWCQATQRLQWSRALTSAEMLSYNTGVPIPLQMLQWSRALTSAEMPQAAVKNPPSMTLQWSRALTSAEIGPSKVFEFQRSPRRSANAPSRSTLRAAAVPRLFEKIQTLRASSRFERVSDFRRHVTARSAQRVLKRSAASAACHRESRSNTR